jgi:adenylate kinase
MMRQESILLMGPTGSGKTPLGDYLENCGLWGRRCHHFDFGAGLREIVQGMTPGFVEAERCYLSDVLEKGKLLENDTFHLAVRILNGFVARRKVQTRDLLVMNGLPRHLGQAEALAAHLEFRAVIYLQCEAGTVWARLQRNAGGDRSQRKDDGIRMVTQKMKLFAERTQPLLNHYQEKGVRLITISVGVDTQPPDIVPLLTP